LHLYTSDPKDLRLLDDARFPHAFGYTTKMLPALHDGRMYFRGHDRLICMDLRLKEGVERRAVRFELPSGMLDDGDPYVCHVRLRDGKPSGGWLRRGNASLYVETDRLATDNHGLSGSVGIQTPYGAYEAFGLFLSHAADRAMTGSVAAVVAPFATPRELAGDIVIGKHDSSWMPACDHVLYLKDAVCDRKDGRQALFMFLTLQDGKVVRVQGTSPRTVKSWFLARHDLRVDGTRITGTVTVLHRPDKWSWALVEKGVRAASRYTLDLDTAKTENAGRFTGTWGVRWDDRRAIDARVLNDGPQ
jgi:hypothetical protein